MDGLEDFVKINPLATEKIQLVNMWEHVGLAIPRLQYFQNLGNCSIFKEKAFINPKKLLGKLCLLYII